MTTHLMNSSEQTPLVVEALHAHLMVRQLTRPDSLGFEDVDTLLSKMLLEFLQERVARAFYATRKQTEDEELVQMGYLQLYPRLGTGITHSLHASYVDRALRYQNVNLYRQHRRNGGLSVSPPAETGDALAESRVYRLSSTAPAPIRRSVLSGDGAALLHQFFPFQFLEGLVFRLWFDRLNPREIAARLNSCQLTVEQGGREVRLPAQSVRDVERLLHAARSRIDAVIEAALPLSEHSSNHQRVCQQLRRLALQSQNRGLTLEECSLQQEARGVRGASVSNLSRKRAEALQHLAATFCRQPGAPAALDWDAESRQLLVSWLDRFFKSVQRRAAASDSHGSLPQRQELAELEFQHDSGFNWETRRKLLLAEPGLSPRERRIIQSLDAETLPGEVAAALRLARQLAAAARSGEPEWPAGIQGTELTEAETTLLSLLALHYRYVRLAESVGQEARREL